MKLSELFNFACKCLALDEYPDYRIEIKKKINSGEVNKDDLIWLCSNHLVIPVLYLKFRKYELLDVFPDNYIKQLKEIYDLNRERNLKILEQINEICILLNQANIRQVYLKGTGNLLDNVYSDIGERMIGDIDLLVIEKDFVKTTEILMSQGYLTSLQTKVAAVPPDHHHFPPLTKNHAPAVVEVHRMPVVAKYSKQFTSEMIFSELKSIPGKTNFFVPSDKHKHIHNFIHSRLSNSGHRFWNLSLRDFYDGYLLSKKVNAGDIINAVEEKTKARIFYHLINRTFDFKRIETCSNDLQVKRYIKIYDWWQEHPKFHNTFYWISDLIHFIFGLYFGTIIKSVYSKSYRQYIWIRIKNPKWYKQHFLLLRHRFFDL